MEYDINELRKRIDSYFLGTLSKEELGRWAEKAYYDLLKGGYIEQKKIVLYPFLKTISQFYIESNDMEDRYPCSEEDVKYISSILSGKEEFDFQIEIAIPVQLYNFDVNKAYWNIIKREIFIELRNAITLWNEDKKKGEKKLCEQLKQLYDVPTLNNTIQDILQNNITMICKSIFDIYALGVKQKKYMKLYAKGESQESLVVKLLGYLDCYIGNRNFNVLVSFKAGLPDMFLMV